jgi:hypothetical protein
MHVAPACTGSGQGSDHFGSFVRSFPLHFCKRLFPGLELIKQSLILENPEVEAELACKWFATP